MANSSPGSDEGIRLGCLQFNPRLMYTGGHHGHISIHPYPTPTFTARIITPKTWSQICQITLLLGVLGGLASVLFAITALSVYRTVLCISAYENMS